ncbi:FHA domain-containing protein [Glaciihabitans sp. dw_435]|uniref:FHA domain-containing protein n=1 Tax=Glaciihabitans sp. dw_435 TaxID=2720081 RepID=UPI001BD2573B|nr:FHA domain-containing protein [Glaciihabitans sp. dw_435]
MHEELDDTVAAQRPSGASEATSEPDLANTIRSKYVVSAVAETVQPKQRPRDASGALVSEPVAPAPPAAPAMFYRFRISRTAIPLDLPAYIGRAPHHPRIAADRMPRLVRVPSPLQEVSSSHLEIRQLGMTVVVTDLKSTNGTIVSVPGTQPRKLRQSESLVVSPGTLIDIGDGNIIEILPMQSL